MKNKVQNLLNKYPIFYNIAKFIYNVYEWLYFNVLGAIFRLFPIKNNKIVMVSYFGRGYGDSPKYISEQLIKNGNYDIVWLVDKKSYHKLSFPSQVRKVVYGSIKALYEMSTAKVWIDNSRKEFYPPKRKKQFYIQTWHGGLALKKIEFDAEDKLTDKYVKVMYKDNKMIDVMTSNSKFCTDMFRRGFKYNGFILEEGTPRNDILVSVPKGLKKRVCNFYNLDEKVNILLYAPTFRNSYEKNPYDIDFDLLRKTLEDKTGETWQIFTRLHPNIKDSSKLLSGSSFIDASTYDDIQELIAASDLLITDYSSTMFEAMIADKPVILYANDISLYKQERGYYFEFSELPFLMSTNNDELISLVKDNDLTSLKKNYSKFIKKVGLKETGKSCLKLAKIIEEKCRGEK